MRATLAAALLAVVTTLSGCGSGDSPSSGDANPDNQQTQQPGPAPSE